MPRDRVCERRAEVRAIAIVAGETRIGLRHIRAGTRLRRRPPVLLWYGQDRERGLRSVPAAYRQFEDLRLAALSGELQVAFGAVDLPEQIRAAGGSAAVVHRECGPALEQSGDGDLILRRHRLAF